VSNATNAGRLDNWEGIQSGATIPLIFPMDRTWPLVPKFFGRSLYERRGGLELRGAASLAALDIGELGDELPPAPVKVVRDGRPLRFEPKPGLVLPIRADAEIGDEFPLMLWQGVRELTSVYQRASALSCMFLCRPQQIEVTDTKRDRYFVHGDHRGIAVTALKTADVLLAEA
jgi:hypothetical protein